MRHLWICFYLNFLSFHVFFFLSNMILSHCYHGNHTVQVQTYPSPRSWWTWSCRFMYYRKKRKYWCFFLCLRNTSCTFLGGKWKEKTPATCVSAVYPHGLCLSYPWLFLSLHHVASFLCRWSDKTFKVWCLTCRWWTRGVNKPCSFTHFRQGLNVKLRRLCLPRRWNRIYTDNGILRRTIVDPDTEKCKKTRKKNKHTMVFYLDVKR